MVRIIGRIILIVAEALRSVLIQVMVLTEVIRIIRDIGVLPEVPCPELRGLALAEIPDTEVPEDHLCQVILAIEALEDRQEAQVVTEVLEVVPEAPEV